jgi:hypothetical protein
LSEHSELRSALRLKSAPNYTTLYRFLTGLQDDDAARVMSEVMQRMPGKAKAWPELAKGSCTAAVDATGLLRRRECSIWTRVRAR